MEENSCVIGLLVRVWCQDLPLWFWIVWFGGRSVHLGADYGNFTEIVDDF